MHAVGRGCDHPPLAVEIFRNVRSEDQLALGENRQQTLGTGALEDRERVLRPTRVEQQLHQVVVDGELHAAYQPAAFEGAATAHPLGLDGDHGALEHLGGRLRPAAVPQHDTKGMEGFRLVVGAGGQHLADLERAAVQLLGPDQVSASPRHLAEKVLGRGKKWTPRSEPAADLERLFAELLGIVEIPLLENHFAEVGETQGDVEAVGCELLPHLEGPALEPLCGFEVPTYNDHLAQVVQAQGRVKAFRGDRLADGEGSPLDILGHLQIAADESHHGEVVERCGQLEAVR